ncbi:mannose/fructose/sorbose PTS transporter subunit IIA [Enterococcus sp. AZ109]|uniref:mannose/fructose/sorbose PTS transporter subunit IIA n=1 Tax=Enterococcus sp. AZ109 TaxID=2774634 RepID=UPI003F2866DC
MVKLIVSGHGDISLGMLDAFGMIFGEDPEVKAVPFLKGEGLPQIQAKFQDEVDKLVEKEGILFLVDIFGGTPYNAAAQLVYTLESADIVTGVNLPILLEAATAKSSMDVAELTAHLKNVGSNSIKLFTEEIQKVTQSDQEEDLL